MTCVVINHFRNESEENVTRTECAHCVPLELMRIKYHLLWTLIFYANHIDMNLFF